MIKTSIKKAQCEIGYPKLMIDSYKKVVLMQECGWGFVVANGEGSCAVGYHSDSWNMEAFEDFAGSIELSNEQPTK